MIYQRITAEPAADGVTLITINRPGRRNAICKTTAIELQLAFAESIAPRPSVSRC